MKQLLTGLMVLALLSSCSKTEEGFLGEWEGKIERLNSEGNLVEVDISCNIKSTDGNNRSIELSVGAADYKFGAIEELDLLIYEDVPLNSDSTIITYISGSAEILADTILYFDHKVFALKNNALLYSEREIFEMKRK